MSDHTPGPLCNLGKVALCEIGNFIAIGVAATNGPTAYVAEEGDANLYIAAPDLLEALKAYMELDNPEPQEDPGARSLGVVERMMRMAISKAGRTK